MTTKQPRKRRSLASPPPKAQPDLTAAHKQAILAALRWAWAELSTADPKLVRRGSEEEITAALERLLNRFERGKRKAIWLTDFETVTRGAKVQTADGRLEKQPDLHFRPPPYRTVVCASDWAWFVECKIVAGGRSVRLYCEQGVARFHVGEYAARMPSAAMVGYRRERADPATALSVELKRRQGTRTVRAGPSADLCQTIHRRKRPLDGDIELTHLWLGE